MNDTQHTGSLADFVQKNFPGDPTGAPAVVDRAYVSQAPFDTAKIISLWEQYSARAAAGKAYPAEAGWLTYSYPLPLPQSVWMPAQKPTVSRALAELKPGREFKNAIAAIQESAKKYADIVAKIEGLLHHGAASEAQRLADTAADRFLAGDETAFDEPRNVKAVEASFDAQRDTLHRSAWRLGHSQVEPALFVRDTIAAALAALVKKSEVKDVDECGLLGLAVEFSAPTKLAQCVAVQFAIRTLEIRSFTAVPKKDPMSCFAVALFSDFIEL